MPTGPAMKKEIRPVSGEALRGGRKRRGPDGSLQDLSAASGPLRLGFLFLFLLEHASGETDQFFYTRLPYLLFLQIFFFEGFTQLDHQFFQFDGF